MIVLRWPIAIFSILLFLSQKGVLAQASTDTVPPTQNTTYWLAPPTEFYPQYIADPRRAQSALMRIKLPRSEIPNDEDTRIIVRFGGRFSLVRFHPEGNRDIGWQIDIEAGFFSQFNAVGAADNYGWDGVYGLLASYKPKPDLGFRFGMLHDSAHVGDEYIEDTGWQRMAYTREELVAGISWLPHHQWRLYSEAAYEYDPTSPGKDERIQYGIEYFGLKPLWLNRLRWYAAADFNLFSERNWAPASTVQLGVIMPTGHGSSRYRIALELYDGRSQLGEFSEFDETYIGLGLYYDN